jgi:Glycosyl hydrolases family 2
MTAGEVLERIKKNFGSTWREGGYRNTFKAGGPDTEIQGIATTFMCTLDLLQRALAAGMNMVIPCRRLTIPSVPKPGTGFPAKLWWPVGYGPPNLYKVDLTFETADKKVSDTRSFQSGVRQMTYKGEGRRPHGDSYAA